MTNAELTSVGAGSDPSTAIYRLLKELAANSGSDRLRVVQAIAQTLNAGSVPIILPPLTKTLDEQAAVQVSDGMIEELAKNLKTFDVDRHLTDVSVLLAQCERHRAEVEAVEVQIISEAIADTVAQETDLAADLLRELTVRAEAASACIPPEKGIHALNLLFKTTTAAREFRQALRIEEGSAFNLVEQYEASKQKYFGNLGMMLAKAQVVAAVLETSFGSAVAAPAVKDKGGELINPLPNIHAFLLAARNALERCAAAERVHTIYGRMVLDGLITANQRDHMIKYAKDGAELPFHLEPLLRRSSNALLKRVLAGKSTLRLLGITITPLLGKTDWKNKEEATAYSSFVATWRASVQSSLVMSELTAPEVELTNNGKSALKTGAVSIQIHNARPFVEYSPRNPNDLAFPADDAIANRPLRQTDLAAMWKLTFPEFCVYRNDLSKLNLPDLLSLVKWVPPESWAGNESPIQQFNELLLLDFIVAMVVGEVNT